jgi:pimeloyl-ACP methyl ester carboxylesterase
MKQRISVAPHLQIAYQVYGEGSRDIVLFHGLMGSSRLQSDWIEAIEESDVRCIALERPGYGESSPIQMRRVADWAPIIAAVVAALDIKEAIAVGCSAGSVYAYASAFFAHDVFKEVWILDGVPAVYLDSILRHYDSEARESYARFLRDPLQQTQAYYVAGLDDFLANLRRTLPDGSDEYLLATLGDARAHRCFGPAQESRLQITPWGFDPAEIRQPVTIWHAQEDTLVPYAVALEMASLLDRAQLITADKELFDENDSAMDVHILSITYGFLRLLRDRVRRTYDA